MEKDNFIIKVNDLMKSEKFFSQYGFTKSLCSHADKFFFAKTPDVDIEKFRNYLSLMDNEIMKGNFDKELTLFAIKVFLDLQWKIITDEITKEVLKAVKEKHNGFDLQPFIEQYYTLLNHWLHELKEDVKKFAETLKNALISGDKTRIDNVEELLNISYLGKEKTKVVKDFLNIAKTKNKTSPDRGKLRGLPNVNIPSHLTITQKLDFWKEFLDSNFLDNDNEVSKSKVLKVFGCFLYTSLLIPEPIFEKHFKNEQLNPEYTFWMLKYNAYQYYKFYIKDNKLKSKLDSDIREITIKRELKKITGLEKRADELYINNRINPDKEYTYSEYSQEIELIRVKHGYYKSIPFTNFAKDNPTSIVYANCIYLKEFLESELNKATSFKHPHIIDAEEVTTKDEKYENIKSHLIEFMDNFIESDFDTLVLALKQYIETDSFPELKEPLKTQYKISVNPLGWVINRALHQYNKSIKKEVLEFAIKYIPSVYGKYDLSEVNFMDGKIYRYFTQNPATKRY